VSCGTRAFGDDPNLLRRGAFTLSRRRRVVARLVVTFTESGGVRAGGNSTGEDSCDNGGSSGGDCD
jgi:hypothetical protein